MLYDSEAEISIDEIFCLKNDIKSFLDTFDYAERAYCEGWSEYEEIRQDAEQEFAKLRSRIRGLAIAWGIHADFLREYTEVEKRYGLKISA